MLDEYQQKVFGTCISLVANQEDVEDIAQDVFIEVFNSISKFKGDSKLSTWIYRILTNKWNLITGDTDAIYDTGRNGYFDDEDFVKTKTQVISFKQRILF